ncbi:MAG: carbohydrate ABC transporter permease [Treponema sp.]|nr:carbohydrate ABC transporter permease [Treponema sp.]
MKSKRVRGDTTFNVSINILLTLLSLFTVLPIVLLVVSSFTSEATILHNGYTFFPQEGSLNAYRYLLVQGRFILNSLKISFLITAVGTAINLFISSLLAYPLSRKDFPFRVPLSFLVFFTLLFNGGLVPTYLTYTQIFHIKNTIFGQIVPSLLMNGFTVILIRTYFATNIPDALIESARLDGAGETLIFFRIVMPLSLPILATVGLMSGLAYWNDWFNGFIYINKPELYSLQNILNRMIRNIEFLQQNSSLSGNVGSQLSRIPTTTVRMAIAAVGAAPIMIIYPFFQRYFVKGIVIGAVKG